MLFFADVPLINPMLYGIIAPINERGLLLSNNAARLRNILNRSRVRAVNVLQIVFFLKCEMDLSVFEESQCSSVAESPKTQFLWSCVSKLFNL